MIWDVEGSAEDAAGFPVQTLGIVGSGFGVA